MHPEHVLIPLPLTGMETGSVRSFGKEAPSKVLIPLPLTGMETSYAQSRLIRRMSVLIPLPLTGMETL